MMVYVRLIIGEGERGEREKRSVDLLIQQSNLDGRQAVKELL